MLFREFGEICASSEFGVDSLEEFLRGGFGFSLFFVSRVVRELFQNMPCFNGFRCCKFLLILLIICLNLFTCNKIRRIHPDKLDVYLFFSFIVIPIFLKIGFRLCVVHLNG